MTETTSPAAVTWSATVGGAAPGAPRRFPWTRALPAIGPLLLFIVWDLSVRLGFIKALLLPPPWAKGPRRSIRWRIAAAAA